jgi:Nitrous oxide-stimulated promoter
MALTSERLLREHETIRAMVAIYCRDKHGGADGLCAECADLLSYATVRLERCRFQEKKPPCANCPVHCYQPARREKVKAMMRHAGPRMLRRHPVLTLRHWLDGLHSAPPVSAISGTKGQ